MVDLFQLRVMSWYSYEQVSPLAMQVWCFKVSDDFECYGRNHLKWIIKKFHLSITSGWQTNGYLLCALKYT